MFLASCYLTCAGNNVRLAEKNDVKEDTTQWACLYCSVERDDSADSFIKAVFHICNANLYELTHTLTLLTLKESLHNIISQIKYCNTEDKEYKVCAQSHFLTHNLKWNIVCVQGLHYFHSFFLTGLCIYVYLTAAMATSKYYHPFLFISHVFFQQGKG